MIFPDPLQDMHLSEGLTSRHMPADFAEAGPLAAWLQRPTLASLCLESLSVLCTPVKLRALTPAEVGLCLHNPLRPYTILSSSDCHSTGPLGPCTVAFWTRSTSLAGLPADCRGRWESFVEETLTETNRRNAVDLVRSQARVCCSLCSTSRHRLLPQAFAGPSEGL